MAKVLFTNTQEEQAYERMMQEIPRFGKASYGCDFCFCEDEEEERGYG